MERVWRTGNPFTLLGIQTGTATNGEQRGDSLKNWEYNCHTTQQSHCWAYTPRKPELKKTHVPHDHCSTIYTARTRKQPRCPSADERIRKLWYIHTMEYYSAIKRNLAWRIPMDRGAWWATVHVVTKSWTQLNDQAHKKECIWVSSNEVDEPGDYYTECNKKDRQILYINSYIWNVERWYWQSRMQGSKGDTKNRLLDSEGEGEGGMIWENSTETYTLP